MPLPCPMCGSFEAFWEEPEPAPRGLFKALLRPFEVFSNFRNTSRNFGVNGYGLTPSQRTEAVRASGRRFIKKWSCPVCGKAGEETA